MKYSLREASLFTVRSRLIFIALQSFQPGLISLNEASGTPATPTSSGMRVSDNAMKQPIVMTGEKRDGSETPKRAVLFVKH